MFRCPGRASAADPALRGQANQAIAEVTRNMTPAERGAVIGSSGMSGGARQMTGSGAGNAPQVTIRVISGNDPGTMWKWSGKVEFSVQ